jgi:hypothetical protein
MATPVVMPVSDERMVAVTRGQGRVSSEQPYHRPQGLIKGGAMPSSLRAFVVPLKVDGPPNRPQGDQRITGPHCQR